VSSLFSRLDYCGIAILIVGSVIPWLYYGFYCEVGGDAYSEPGPRAKAYTR
jgi:predicted membrane channel-forming protein YqfA (hemolysin III family)